MPLLILEDGSGAEGANTYATLEMANAYWTEALSPRSWFDECHDDSRREAALIAATDAIDRHFRFVGEPCACCATARQWPRCGYDCRGCCLDCTSIPKDIITATFILSEGLLSGDVELYTRKRAVEMTGINVGGNSMTFARPTAVEGECGDITAVTTDPFAAIRPFLQCYLKPHSGGRVIR